MDDTTRRNLVEALREALPNGLDYILDTTGNMDVIAAVVVALGPGGTCGMVGAAPSASAELRVNYRDFLGSGKRLMGIIEGGADPHAFIPALVSLSKDGRLPLERLVTTYPFSSINRAIDDLNCGRVIEPVLLLNEL